MKYVRDDAVIVIDPGADCNVLYDSFLQSSYKFFISKEN